MSWRDRWRIVLAATDHESPYSWQNAAPVDRLRPNMACSRRALGAAFERKRDARAADAQRSASSTIADDTSQNPRAGRRISE